MSEPPRIKQPDKSASHTWRYVLATIAFLLLALTATQIFLHQPSVGNPMLAPRTFQLWTATVLVVLALLLLATLLGRNLIKLYFERKSGQVGSRIRGKMVSIFVVLSLLPAVLLFSLAYYLVTASMERWFTTPAAELQDYSKDIAEQYYSETAERARSFAVSIAERAGAAESLQLLPQSDLGKALLDLRRLYRIGDIRIYDKDGVLSSEMGKPASSGDQKTDLQRKADLEKLVSGGLQGISDPPKLQRISPTDALHDMIWVTAPIRDRSARIIGVVATETEIPDSVRFKAQSVMQAYAAYAQLQKEKTAVRRTTLLMFALCTLLIVFAFSWFAMYLAKRITVPIQALAEGAAAVAAGNLDYRVYCTAFDELENLVTSFNRMTAELQENKANIEAAQSTLRETNVMLDDRRRFIETILHAIPTGVVVLNGDHRILTMNRAALQMLEAHGQSGNSRLEDVVKGQAGNALGTLLRKSSMFGPVVRDIDLDLQGKTLHLAATVTPLIDSSEQQSGWVIVLDDLTELLRMEKMSAWQEVARRLAHEIKNPLTPIQLSAERMLHRFRQIPLPGGRAAQGEAWREQLAAYEKLLSECVQTIIREADSLKNLVDEFSGFARLPGVRLEETDLHRVLESALSLYNGRSQDVQIERVFDPGLPPVLLDGEQMKRVFINLFDNAFEAMSGDSPAKVLRVCTSRNVLQRSVRIEISDTGCGFPEEYQDSLFLPYFSTRRGGTGLGLAIVRQVVSDHRGHVRMEPNVPLGTRIVIDLPLASS
jgi:two-component system nitrogen regulation sensor histidine kinase NtrY